MTIAHANDGNSVFGILPNDNPMMLPLVVQSGYQAIKQ
jgi:hypothetical protein